MARKQNPSEGSLLAIAAGGAALYYFWQSKSSSSSAAATPGAAGPAAAIVPAAPPEPLSRPALLQLVHNNLRPAVTPAATIAPNSSGFVTVPTGDATYGPTPNASASFPMGVYLTPAQWSQWQQETLAFNAAQSAKIMPQLLQGVRRRLRGDVPSPAAIHAAVQLQAHLNNTIADGGPQVTNGNNPIGPWTPGAELLPGGCYRYGNTPVLINCPPGATPPDPRDPANGKCLPGFTMSASGQCAKTDDQAQLAQLNSTPYESGTIPEASISPTVLGVYASTIGINPGSYLAAMLGLPSDQAYGTFAHGNDGFNYLMVDGVFMRQGTATQLTRNTGPIGPRIAPFPAGTKLRGILPAAVPITSATLQAASTDPDIAAMVGNDPRAMLTVSQWNYYATQALGVLQVAPPYPEVDPNALISAQQYQAWRIEAGLTPDPKRKLGLIRSSRPGAFPLGGIHDGPSRMPFIQPGNHNIFRVPGRGAVRLGVIHAGGGNHRWSRSPFPRAAGWREAE